MQLKGKSFLKLLDFSSEEIEYLVDYAAELKAGAQLVCVAEISVVCQGELTFLVVYNNGLAVCAVCAAGGAVAHMPHRHAAIGKLVHYRLCKYIIHRAEILVYGENAVIVNYNAAALLPSVLQCVQRVVCHSGEIVCLPGVCAEYAALLM